MRRTLSNEQLSYKFTVENVVVDRSQFSLKKNWNAQAGDSTSEARLHKGRETLRKGRTFSI